MRVVKLDYPGGFGAQYWSWWPLGWRYVADEKDYHGIKRFYKYTDALEYISRLEDFRGDCKEDLRVGC